VYSLCGRLFRKPNTTAQNERKHTYHASPSDEICSEHKDRPPVNART
jgi:hypothetical protein